MRRNKILFLILFSAIFAQGLGDLQRLANEELDKLRSELQSQTKASIVQSINESTNQGPVAVTSTAASLVTGDFFGYNFFRKNHSFLALLIKHFNSNICCVSICN